MPVAALLALSLAVVPVDAPLVEGFVLAPAPEQGRTALELWLSVAAIAPADAIRLHAEPLVSDLEWYRRSGVRPVPREPAPEAVRASLRELREAVSRAPPGRSPRVYLVAVGAEALEAELVSALRWIDAPLVVLTDDIQLASKLAESSRSATVLVCRPGGERLVTAVAGALTGVADVDLDGEVGAVEAAAWFTRVCEPEAPHRVLFGNADATIASGEGQARIGLDEALTGALAIQPMFAPAPWLVFHRSEGPPSVLRAPAALYRVLRQSPDGELAGAAFRLRPGDLRRLTPASFNLSAPPPARMHAVAVPTAREVAAIENSLRPAHWSLALGAAAYAESAPRVGAELLIALQHRRLFAGAGLDATWTRDGGGAVGAEMLAGPAIDLGGLRLAGFAAVGARLGSEAGAAHVAAGALAELRLAQRLGIYARAQVGLIGWNGWEPQGRGGAGVSIRW